MTKSRIAWAGLSWRLRVEEVTRPDNQPVEKGYIEHPGSVVLVPMRGDDVLLIRQFRPALGEEIEELPAGTREGAEPWLACAQRELREETGYRAGVLVPLGKVWAAPGLSDELMAIYLATDLTEDPLLPDFDEQIELVPMSLDRLVSQAVSGELQDAKSVVGVLRAAHYLKTSRQ